MVPEEDTADIEDEYTDSSATKLSEDFQADEGLICRKIEELGRLIDRVRDQVDVSLFSDALRNLSRKAEA